MNRLKLPWGLAVAVLAVLVAVGIWFVLHGRALGLEGEIARREAEFVEMADSAGRLEQLRGYERQLTALLRKEERRLLDVQADAAVSPEAQDTLAQSKLSEIFSGLVEQAGTKVTRSQYPSAKKPDKELAFRFVKYTGRLQCDEKQLAHILRGLANHEKLIPVSNLRITSQWRNPKVRDVSADITIGGYYRPSTAETTPTGKSSIRGR